MLRNARQGYLPAISEVELDGVKCKLLEWEYPEVEMAQKIWVVPDKGHMIKRVQGFHKGAMTEERRLLIKSFGKDVFWFSEAEEKDFDYDGSLTRRKTLKVRKMEPGVPVDDKLFTLEGMDVPPGTEIQARAIEHEGRSRYRY